MPSRGTATPIPRLIQGGMGVGISNWRLANAVSRLGHLGVVSGTALDQVLVRRLQDGDRGGHMRRALDWFPIRAIAERIWDEYYVPGGKHPQAAYKTMALHARPNSRHLEELCVAANFVEVTLARERHAHAVGINYLEKIQIPHLPSIYGAMLAGVDFILMGAGIPLRIPAVLDRLAEHAPVTYPLTVTGATASDDTRVTFRPDAFDLEVRVTLKRPRFVPIVASDVLALTLARKATGRVDGFIVEGPTAGGHNAPPRGRLQLDDRGQPMYGPRDEADLSKLRDIGLPFWLAGGRAHPDGLRAAVDEGAAGIQVGTAFSLCRESGLRADYKDAMLRGVADGSIDVFTDPRASPTGFPFKIANLAGTQVDDDVYRARPRICDLGYLREAYRTPEGTIGFRCAAEPVSLYVSKGGAAEDTAGRKCICNALMASAGHPQVRAGRYVEAGLVTAGDDLECVRRLLASHPGGYTAADVAAMVLGG